MSERCFTWRGLALVVVSIATGLTVSAGLVAIVLGAAGYHLVWKPTPDQLYGCTVQQQAPNGECQ